MAALDFNPGARPELLHQEMQQLVDTVHEDQAKGLSLSESFTLIAEKNSVGYYHWQGDGISYDGSIRIAGDSLVIVVPSDDIGTAGFWQGFWKKFVQGLVATATAVASGALCLLFFNVGAPAAAPVCGAVAGGLSAGVGELVGAVLDEKPIDGEAWGAALGSAIWGALGGAFTGGLMQFASASSRSLIAEAQTTLRSWVSKLGSWGNPLGAVADVLNGNAATRLLETLQRLNRGLGGTAAEPLPVPDVRWEATGDSITYADGFGSSTGGGYIEDLDSELGSATQQSLLGPGAVSTPLITKRAFVGDRSAGGFANEAWPGEEIAQIERDSEATFGRYRPNVVSVLAGTNDMVHNTDVAHAADRLDAYLGQILADDPGVTLLVATLPPSTNTEYQARINAYNDGVRRVADARHNAGQHVLLVELSWLTTADLHDVVHPNDAGYQKIADSFYWALLTTIQLGWVAPPGTPTSPSGPAECNERGGWQPKGTVTKGVNGKPSDDLRHRVRFADLDGDGKADYLVLGDGASIVAYLNRGTDASGGGGWQYRGEYAAGGNFTIGQVRLADVNGDGKADYLVVHDGGEVDAWINHGGDYVDGNGWHPTWEAWPQFARGGTGATVDQIQFADIDGDGRADYLKVDPTTGALTEWRNNGGDRPGVNGWEPRGQIARGGLGHDWPYLHLADVNCDHRTDYLVTNFNGGVQTFLDHGGDHDGIDGWQPIGVTAPGIGDPLVQFADLDGDGRADYLVVGFDGSVTEYRNNGGDPA
ncbi:FG-GAP-like repeat-containing protein [Streptomyces sp. NPDC017248]|uniref:FG-GAP-like repeat-containing protein n=1 Tax=unclassified Streptomyces TaxID=2593676 RepID=UPI0037BA062B